MSDFPLQMPEASYIQVDSNSATKSFHLAFILSFSSWKIFVAREGCSEGMKSQDCIVRSCHASSQRLISDKVRLVHKAAAAQPAEKSRVQGGQIPCRR